MHYSKVRGPEQANFLDAGRNLCYYETVINKTLRVPLTITDVGRLS
jgi:hypothetical protein